MDAYKKIDGVRYSLNQNQANQVTVRKEKEVILVQNLDHKLDMQDAFAILAKTASGKISNTGLKGNEEKLNTEVKEEKIIVPTPNPCLFCGGVPKVINMRSAENSSVTLRALQCTGLNCASSVSRSELTGEVKATFKRWAYTVDVIDSVEKADAKLITEWNRRMPLAKRK